MKAVTVCVVATVLVCSVIAVLPPSDKSYKILMLIPFWGKSHKNVFMPLAEALADRGHKVVMLSMMPNSSSHQNITEISYVLPNINADSSNMFHYIIKSNQLGGFIVLKTYLTTMARELYNVPHVKKLYEKRKQFDLVLVDYLFSKVVYPFVHEVPFVTISTPGMDARQSAVLGNVLSPSYFPNLWTIYPLPLTLWHRLQNTVLHTWMHLYWTYSVVPLVHKEILAHFPDFPPLLEIERNTSLTLINTHFSITPPVPLLPSQVEVGAMHCRPAKPLPQNLESWIAGAGSAGVIYFSLGSSTRGDLMPPKYRQAILEAFRRLPQRVLWKYEGELEGVSDNVKISSWLPQQDILGHDNVKVFISQGGLLSLQESIFHITPLLVIPIFGDQLKNSLLVENSGLGRMLVWEELTADRIVDTLTDIITNTKYKENLARMSESLKDQLTTPQELAVFWTEYVIRHRGAPQLRFPAAHLSWVEFFMLDLVGLLLLALLVLLLVLRRLLVIISAVIFGGRTK